MNARPTRPQPSTEMSFETQLSAILGPLRRAVLRRTRAAEGLPDLPEAQVELLRLLVSTAGAPPGHAAEALEVAQSTISNLVRTMAAAGLVERHTRTDDRRAVFLVASPRAHDLLARYDRASSAILHAALNELSAGDQHSVRQALPALQRLLTTLAVLDPPQPFDG
ncbi:MarR family winged helix-turn-helix transcriptional regulator [Nocardia niwae]|uniref:MarR family winged helix-turn-helix transcriptional regulator n=1 Tax=Nocardia niwae TaxID=626084 RepID=UPI0033CD648D